MLHNINLFTNSQLEPLVQSPPKLTGKKLPGLPSLSVPTDSDAIEYITYSGKFGNLPEGLELPPGCAPIAAPVWLAEALPFGADAAAKLLGFKVLYQFEPDSGGWALGVIKEVNLDEAVTVDVVTAEGISGTLPANFTIHYPIDNETLPHRLTLSDYAASVDADTSTFVLLADSAMGATRGRKPAPLQLEGGGGASSEAPLLQLEVRLPAGTGGEQ